MNQVMLEKLIEKNFDYYKEGNVADYIPALAQVDPKQLGISIYDVATGEVVSAGASQQRFAIESMSKVPVLLLAIADNGLDVVLEKVKTEATGFSFNSIMNMEINQSKRPLNPFVNAGAIAVTSLIKGKDYEEKFQRILAFIQELCDDKKASLDEEIYQSEARTGDINRSLVYYMKGHGMITGDAAKVLDIYFKQCSINVTAEGIAKMAAVLANKGIAPWNNKRLISHEAATVVKSIMVTAGLYDESGSFSAKVGVPTKSGVGGGLLTAAPNRCGIGIFSPALDKYGNSIAGLHLLKDVVDEMGLNIFS